MATKYNIELPQGEDYQLSITYRQPDGTPVDLTGSDARMMVRTKYTDVSPVVSLTTTDSPHGKITLGGAAGTIVVLVKNAHTSTLAPGRAVYDLELIDGSGKVKRLLEGVALITPEVTK